MNVNINRVDSDKIIATFWLSAGKNSHEPCSHDIFHGRSVESKETWK